MSTNDDSQAVLVLGDDTRSFLSVVRSFGRRGFRVDVCPFDFSSPALRSAYIRRIYHLPVYHLDFSRWISVLRELISNGMYNFIVPCDDRSILPIHRHLGSFGGAPFALPNEEAIRIFFDKFETRQLAQASGVPVATGRLLVCDDTADDVFEEFGFPLVIKPRSSYDIDNVGIRNNVRIVHDIDALQEEMSAEGNTLTCLVERWLPGYGVGVSVLAHCGRLVQAFEHHRLHEPQSGGGSSYRVSKSLNPILIGHVKKMIVTSKLDGVAMFEFRYDPDTGEINLLEVNARFWGGLPLAIGAGIDFPWLLYRQSVLNEAVIATSYRTGYYARSLMADVYTVMETAEKLGRKSAFKAIAFLLGTVFTAALRLALSKERNDTFSWVDTAPFKEECRLIIGRLGSKLGRMTDLPSRWKAKKSRGAVRSMLERYYDGRIKILFLCYGNICRSPFAARYLQTKFSDQFEVYSTGVHPVVERTSPTDAVECAQAWGVNLVSHQSSHISFYADTLIDLVVLFDEENLDNLRASGCFQTTLTVKLGAFRTNTNAGPDIVDPYGRGPDSFRIIYGQIADAVDSLVSIGNQTLRRRPGWPEICN